jgi:hypothetical protein
MAIFKQVWFFTQFNQGWTETYYLDVANLTFAASPDIATQNVIMGTKIFSVNCTAVRASDVTAPRTSKITALTLTGQSPPSSALRPDITSTAALVRLFSPGGYPIRSVDLRGLDDFYTERDANTGQSIPNALLRGKINDFIAKIADPRGPYKIKHFNNDLVANPLHAVTSIHPNAINANQADIETPDAAAAPIGTAIVFRGIPQDDLPGLKGTFVVLANSGVALTINYRYRGRTTLYLPTNGFWRKALYTYAGMIDGTFIRFISRQTGRPITPSRGRGRAVIRRQ